MLSSNNRDHPWDGNWSQAKFGKNLLETVPGFGEKEQADSSSYRLLHLGSRLNKHKANKEALSPPA